MIGFPYDPYTSMLYIPPPPKKKKKNKPTRIIKGMLLLFISFSLHPPSSQRAHTSTLRPKSHQKLRAYSGSKTLVWLGASGSRKQGGQLSVGVTGYKK